MGLHPAVHIFEKSMIDYINFQKRMDRVSVAPTLLYALMLNVDLDKKFFKRSYNEVKRLSCTKTPKASECSEGSHSKNS